MVDLMNVFANSALFQAFNCGDYYLKEIRMESEVSHEPTLLRNLVKSIKSEHRLSFSSLIKKKPSTSERHRKIIQNYQ